MIIENICFWNRAMVFLSCSTWAKGGGLKYLCNVRGRDGGEREV